MRKHGFLKSFLLVAVFVFGISLPPVPVNATLLIMPIHLILGDRDRTGNITIFNTSGEESVFRIAWRFQKQLENGSYEVSDAAFDPDHDLSKIAVFSPRQVTLQAGQKQRIRVSIRRPPDIADGEYRAHLALIRMGDEDPNGAAENARSETPAPSNDPNDPVKQERAQVSIGLKVNVSYSLPVVLRQGAYDTTATIAEAKIVPPDAATPNAKPQLAVVLNRNGKYSVFGKLVVYWTPPGGAEKQIGVSNNVNIFPEISKRDALIQLSESTIAGGTLRVSYQGELKEKGIVLDEKTFPVGG